MKNISFKSFLLGILFTTMVLIFYGMSSYYSIDDVMSKLDDIEYSISSIESMITDIEYDVSYIKRNCVGYDDVNVEPKGVIDKGLELRR